MTRRHGRVPGDGSGARTFFGACRIGLLAAVLAALALPAWGQIAAPSADNHVVLRVNDRIATLFDYQRGVAEEVARVPLLPGLTDQQRQQRIADAGRLVMKRLFERLLLLSRADQLAVVVDESDVEEQIRTVWERFGIQNQEEFRQALAQQGISEADFRTQTREQIRENIVQGREVAPRIVLGDEDLRRFYRENESLFQIEERARFEEVVLLEDTVPEDRLAPLAALAGTRMKAGGTAEEVAEGLGEGATAVDVGWVSPGDLAPALDAVAWDLEVGGVAEPVAARGGLHVVKMLEETPASVRPFEEVRDAIEQRERGRLFSEEMELYLQELADAAYIVERLPDDAQGYRPVEAASLDADALGLLAPFAPGAQALEEVPASEEPAEGDDEAEGDESQP